jgi:sarcosine oxidase subunit gamma
MWQTRCAGRGAAVDLSSALAAFHLAGPAAREVLARGCRLDLDREAFPSGHAAATMMAQVSTVLAALPSGLLLLTPSSTARHFRDWLASSAKPFGCVEGRDGSLEDLCGDERS